MLVNPLDPRSSVGSSLNAGLRGVKKERLTNPTTGKNDVTQVASPSVKGDFNEYHLPARGHRSYSGEHLQPCYIRGQCAKSNNDTSQFCNVFRFVASSAMLYISRSVRKSSFALQRCANVHLRYVWQAHWLRRIIDRARPCTRRARQGLGIVGLRGVSAR